MIKSSWLSCGLACFLSMTCALSANAQDDYIRARMLGDLDFIKNSFYTSYASADWKIIYSGWNLEAEIAEAKAVLHDSDVVTTKDFQRLVKKLFNSAKDYHVSAEFYSTETATLPFLVEGNGKRYFFSYVSESAYTDGENFPFKEGDEIISFDDTPIADVIAGLMNTEYGNNHEATDRMFAEITLTTRIGKEGDDVPNGKVKITGIRKRDLEKISYVMDWDYEEEKVTNIITTTSKFGYRPNPSFKTNPPFKTLLRDIETQLRKKTRRFVGKNPYFHKEFISTKYADIKSARVQDDDEARTIGSKKSHFPILGEVIWEAPEDYSFHAYLFYTPEKKIAGYIRIPSYNFDDVDQAVSEFAEIISLFQDEADVLLIDQLSNPGGYLALTYAFASMLSDSPLDVPRHRRMITQEDVYFAHSTLELFEMVTTEEDAQEFFGKTFDGLPTSLKLIESMISEFKETISEWDQGHNFTNYGYMYGIGPLDPHPDACFTKPILCLINSLDISGGDFFPAILQDNHRALIMGSRTAGAGGYVTSIEFPNLNGIKKFRMTGSIAARPGDILIENIGVTPDIWYEPSINDLQWNYTEYKRKVLRVLDTL